MGAWILPTALLAGAVLAGPPAQAEALRALTVQEVVDYDAAPYVPPKEGLRRLVGQHFVLGTLDGIPVKVDTFCSDVCPDYTTRVVYLEPPAGKACAEAGGVETKVSIPVSIARQLRTFCLPKVIVDARRKAAEVRHIAP